ncbi:hypothetical protein B296_00045889 [Ensete ventricosum]|uniref:Protein kinase domain-containing protein n=1 Tax=Ensete ventricosum TaxID=4639 RepID=A0A426Y9U1_ENSVE|nr:hypothetical protein B296_00045889 [Ensete ventricosum]
MSAPTSPLCAPIAPQPLPPTPPTVSPPAFLHRGFHVKWDSPTDPYFAKSSFCISTIGGTCSFNDSASGKPFMCFPSSDHLHRNDSVASHRLLFLTTTLFATACLFPLGCCHHPSSPSTRERPQLRLHYRFPPLAPPPSPDYTYEQLHASTDGFDPCHKISDGKFRSSYLAHLDDGRVAAVKHLHRQHPAAMATKSFCNEILMIT